MDMKSDQVNLIASPPCVPYRGVSVEVSIHVMALDFQGQVHLVQAYKICPKQKRGANFLGATKRPSRTLNHHHPHHHHTSSLTSIFVVPSEEPLFLCASWLQLSMLSTSHH